MNSHVVIPVLISFVVSVVLGPVVSTVSLEESGYSDDGRRDDSCVSRDYVTVLR